MLCKFVLEVVEHWLQSALTFARFPPSTIEPYALSEGLCLRSRAP